MTPKTIIQGIQDIETLLVQTVVRIDSIQVLSTTDTIDINNVSTTIGGDTLTPPIQLPVETYEQPPLLLVIDGDGTLAVVTEFGSDTLTVKPIASKTDLSSVMDAIDEIKAVIPTQASPDNQLADKAFVNSTVENMAANRVFYNTTAGNFPTAASITGATEVYNRNGEVYIPTNNDYAIVIADEKAPAPFTNQQARWKYVVDTWIYEYSYNTVFTSNQQQAIDSGITNELVTKLQNLNLEEYQLISEKGQVDGYASLDSSGKVPIEQIPTYESTLNVNP